MSNNHTHQSHPHVYYPLRLGLDPKLLTDVLNVSTGRTFCSELYNPCPGIGPIATNGYQGGFGSKLMAKVRVIITLCWIM